MQLFLIRHAQSQNNALPESQRVSDPGITDLGGQQARALAEHLRDAEIDVLLTSAFRRAMQTMQFIAELRDQPVSIWTDLFEQGGCYSGHVDLRGAPGMNREEIEMDFPNFAVPDDIGDGGWWNSKPYESWEQATDRAKRIVRRLKNDFGDTDQTVACLSHADFKALLLTEMLGNNHPQWTGSYDLRNTGVTILSFENNQFDVVSLNDTSHLNDSLRS